MTGAAVIAAIFEDDLFGIPAEPTVALCRADFISDTEWLDASLAQMELEDIEDGVPLEQVRGGVPVDDGYRDLDSRR